MVIAGTGMLREAVREDGPVELLVVRIHDEDGAWAPSHSRRRCGSGSPHSHRSGHGQCDSRSRTTARSALRKILRLPRCHPSTGRAGVSSRVSWPPMAYGPGNLERRPHRHQERDFAVSRRSDPAVVSSPMSSSPDPATRLESGANHVAASDPLPHSGIECVFCPWEAYSFAIGRYAVACQNRHSNPDTPIWEAV